VGRADVDALRFTLALRGYRMDEVDDVIDRLLAELDRKDARIAELEAPTTAADDDAHDDGHDEQDDRRDADRGA
jgi:DivIVA domain-containing protein